MDKELVRHFIEECKRDQEWDERWRSNYIEFDNYFKYSGKTEETKAIVSEWRYNFNNKCNDIHEKYVSKKTIRNLKKPKDDKRKRTEISSKCLG